MIFSTFADFTFLFAQFELKQLAEYADSVESHLAGSLTEFTEFIESRVQKMSEEDKQEYYEHKSDEYQMLSEAHPNTLRQSMVIALCSFFEKTLNGICKEMQEGFRMEISVSDIEGKGVTRAQKYLKKVMRIKFPDDSSHWREIKLVFGVRNFLVHAAGEIDKTLQEKLAKSKLLAGTYEIRGSSIFIDKSFIPRFSAEISGFLGQLRPIFIAKMKELDVPQRSEV